MKEPIQLRKKPLKSGGYSLYLDYYHDGIRDYKMLKMYLVPETDKASKELNRRTMEAAKVIQMREILKLSEGKAGIRRTATKMKLDEYLEERAKAEKKTTATHTRHIAIAWRDVFGSFPPIASIDSKMLEQFIEGMLKWLSPNTANVFYARLCGHLRVAVRKGLIPSDPSQHVAKEVIPKKVDTNREFLTDEEIRKLVSLNHRYDVTRKAFLFSCFTGLRLSDMETLRWDEISGNYITKKMVKTGKVVRIPLSDNAKAYLPKRRGELVFTLPSRTAICRQLSEIVEDAGIRKHISFHCARHTFATLLITHGADLYTVSKLVGHSNIATTQIYAKIVDRKKEEAIDLVPKF